jgi:histidinol-phosphate aminotransferase
MSNLFRKELAALKKYVPGKPIEEVKREYGLTDIIKLASNENPLGPSPLAIQAIKDEADKVFLYPESTAPALREAIGQRYNISPDQILMGNGGEEILKFIAQTFINEGDEAIMGTPSFGLYNITVSHMGGRPVEVPLTERFEHDFEAMLDAVNEKTKLLYICNPNNPTGNIMTAEKVHKFIQKVPRKVVIVLDEAYYDYAVKNPAYPDGIKILQDRPNTIILRTFSKVAGIAGVRIGYAISSEKIIGEMSKVKGVFNASRIAQAAGIAALKDTGHLEATVDLNYESLNLMVDCFERNGLDYIPSNANFVFMKTDISSKVVYEELLKRGVIIRPGYLWGQENWNRISTGTREQTMRFIEAIEAVITEQK